ncbi:hypothetical protein [[Clostridium] dakarense]|uniref:hypothetical protein n=1 Tax=Faecalimicrobium dakarense TaxID=1301100 RepID=UPI0004BB71A0|nr:hypothetical protein [[Clostridium] dakarense]
MEQIVKKALSELKCSYDRLDNPTIQYLYGDVVILDKHKEPIYADIKASHSWNGVDKVGLDYKHYQKDSEEAYVPSNSNNNEGYIYHLRSDSLICVNPWSKKLYIVNKFQELRKRVLELLDDRGYTTSELLENGIDLSINKNDYDKDTKIINIAFKDMVKLGAEVFQYSFDKLSENEKDSSVGRTQV